jgi:amino acid adenylation domain-containing protein
MKDEQRYEGIAIVGMAVRFPGADGIEEFWTNLVAGRESVSFFSDSELAASGLDAAELKRRGQYVAARGVLKDADCFDAAFFGINPKEAEVMDPQQRLFLEVCWEALERAGYAPDKMRGAVGVFAGASSNTYVHYALEPRPELMELVGADLIMYGNDKDYLTTRVAYKLGLKGPALNVSTACSTSLVAVGQACQSLLTYQCDFALAGGVSVRVPQQRGYYYDEGNIGSPDGHTRTFDSRAAGTTFSNGIGVVVLKRLDEAVNDGDQIYAVIKGVGLNNDGSQRVSFGAPGVEGQSEAVAMAQALAGVDPETITYIEAHGTATPLGDPIEVAGLTKAFRMGTQAKQFCAIGSVKTNVGHLDVAAGVAGLIKTSLALHNKVIPASLHFTKPNPKLEIEKTPFYVNATLQEWKTKPNVPRRAGVSSFGSGGTNAHLVLEEAPALQPSGTSRPWQLLTLSAKTAAALDRATANLSEHLKKIAARSKGEEAQRELADTACTLKTGRSEFVHRRVVACADAAEGAAALAAQDPKRVFTCQQKLTNPPVVFMFPGQGAQYAGMGAELYRTEKTFRAEVDRCAELLKPVLKSDIREVMFPAAGSEKDADALLVQTRFTQPALFVIEYALAKLWMSWGIKPATMIGHSVGEYVAGCLAGVFTLEDALTLIARRAELVQVQPGGAMLAIRLPETEVLPLLTPQLTIAAINSPNLCVVSGPHEAIAELENQLTAKKVAARRLQTSHAFHSPMMEPVLAPFTELLRKVKFGKPEIPYVSNVTARWITAAEAASPEYWADHVRQTVRFADGVAELMKDSRQVLLEVGPGQTLSTLARQHAAKSKEQIVLASLAMEGEQELHGLLDTLGRLWMAGINVDWEQFYADERRRRVVLPAYPFERKRYWPESAPTALRLSAIQNSTTQILGAQNTAAHNGAGVAGNGSYSQAIAEPQFMQTTIDVAAPAVPAQPEMPRKERLLQACRALMEELSGYDLSEVPADASLLELGLDSLLLTQAAQVFHRKFGVSITFRQLMEELSSLQAIAEHLDATLPAEAFAAPVAQVAAPVAGTRGFATAAQQNFAVTGYSGNGGAPNSVLEQILLQQQALTQQILQLMGREVGSAAPTQTTASPTAISTSTSSTPASSGTSVPMVVKSEVKSHGPFKPIDRAAGMAISPEQTAALAKLIESYTKRTPKSKKLAIKNRPMLADPRSVGGFKQLWKEMVYPFYTDRSEGSRVWDVDGNEYVDFVMGFGASIFGHRPPFVVKAVHEQLDRGFETGPIHPLAGEVAELMREFTGMQRVAFTNTGSEAVLAATRVARTVTGRDKIAVFAGAYHGIFDETLFRPLTVNGETRTAASAPGVPASALAQVIVLDYGNPQSLDILRARGSEIAAVLVEPVQSRRLDLQPREFLQELRKVTRETGSALVFDEVVTGFRLEPGGAQAYFGVRADLATYGKVIGGGIPIGAVTGDAKFMDALDGGQWNYGDTSFPGVGVTFFAGTFVRHPLALAAAKAVLLYLKEQGPGLQKKLTARTAELANQLRAIIEEFEAPYHLTQFSSLLQLTYPSEQKFAALLHYLMRERGIHIWDNRAFVITTAHSEADLVKLVSAFRESLAEMVAGGFLPPSSGSGSKLIASAKNSREENSAKKPDLEPVLRESVNADQFPLTEAQQEIWLAAQMGGEAGVGYNESLKLDFHGNFDAESFRAAVRQVIQRHAILRATFSPDGQWQRIHATIPQEIPFIDLSTKREADREIALARVMEQEVTEPFDLGLGPLVRVRVVRLSGDHHVAIWTAHHIVCDGWSGGLVVGELSTIYSSLQQGTEPTLGTPESFQEYAAGTQADSPAATQAMTFWRQQFTDIPAPLDLPTDHTRPVIRSARAATLKRVFDPNLQQSLKRVAGKQRTTLVVVLMAGLEALLYRLTGQTDMVIGLGVAGQAMSGKSCLVGHCVNLLPIRLKVQPTSPFQENLAAVKKGVLDAYDHNQSTVGGILKHLAVPRDPGRPPLVEIIFNLDRDVSTAQFHGTEFSYERNPKRALHYDLFFNFVEGPRGLYVECDYNTDLFESSTIERWLGHYQSVLEGIATNSAQEFSVLPIMNESELQRVLSISSGKESSALANAGLLHEIIERQVLATPNATALSYQGQSLSYNELNNRANQLARHLVSLGVRPNELVGVCAFRSIEMVVALLGTLKAGGAYMPVDPEYPSERLALMLQDAKPRAILTQQALRVSLPANDIPTISLDSEWAVIAMQSRANPNVKLASTDAAYVIYTSGSTGVPKGVVNVHQGIVNRLLWMQEAYQLSPADHVLQKTPYSFDVSVWEFFWPLMTGAQLVIAKPEGHRDPAYLAQLIVESGITTLHFVPSMLRVFLESAALPKHTKLRQVFCSGEALTADLQHSFFAACDADLHNLYGPTEAAVDVTHWTCRRNDARDFVPIGRPITNIQIHILDKRLRHLPIGIPGEIHIGGIGVARGYLNRPELNAERFLRDPFRKQAGALLYKTGDLARYLPTGEIEYLGRMDHQVKIRGLRIELGEIEATLSKHPAVKQCVMVVREDTPGEKTLVAYFEPQSNAAPDISELRSHLKKQLPEYMVPTTFVSMEKISLTSSGKIDRKALPAPGDRALVLGTKETFSAPRDAVEQMLAQLWAKVLKVKRVGLHDDFFELGGHSLLAVRIIVEIEKIYQRRLPLATLIQAPTIGGLAEILRKEDWQPSWSSLVPVQPGGSNPPLFFIHSHGGNVLEYYPLAHHLGADQPVYGLQAKGLDGSIVQKQTLEQIASRYLAEIRSFQPQGPYFLGGFCFGGLVALEAAQQLRSAGEKVALVAMIQTTHPAAQSFAAGSGRARRWYQRAAKRIDLEHENMQHRGVRYFGDRVRRAWDIALARTQISFDRLSSNGHERKNGASMAYVLEMLGREHDWAFTNYVPRPYDGDVVLFRAGKQLPGLASDRYLGWKPVITGNFEVCELPGHQQNILIEPRVSRLAEELRKRLQKTSGEQIAGPESIMDSLLC